MLLCQRVRWRIWGFRCCYQCNMIVTNAAAHAKNSRSLLCRETLFYFRKNFSHSLSHTSRLISSWRRIFSLSLALSPSPEWIRIFRPISTFDYDFSWICDSTFSDCREELRRKSRKMSAARLHHLRLWLEQISTVSRASLSLALNRRYHHQSRPDSIRLLIIFSLLIDALACASHRRSVDCA